MGFIGHSQNQGLGRASGLITASSAPYWKVIDPDPYQAAVIAAQGVKLIVRHNGIWDHDINTTSPEDFCARCFDSPWWASAWAFETPNEPHPGSVEFFQYCVDFANYWEKEVVVGNWSTGNEGFYVPGAKYYACHEYGFPSIMSQAGDHALRYRNWFPAILEQNPEAKLFITECGVTKLVVEQVPEPEGVSCGWQKFMSAEEYVEGLREYLAQLQQDPYVIPYPALFQVGGNPDWWTFEGLHHSAVERLVLESNS